MGLDSRRLVLGPLGVERHVVAAALDGLAEVDRVGTLGVIGPAGEGVALAGRGGRVCGGQG